MRCDRVVRHLDPFRTDELSVDEKAAIERHLDCCPPCRSAFEGLERLAASTRSLMGGVPCSCLEAVKEAVGDRYDLIESELGRLWVAFSKHGIREIRLAGDSEDELVREYRLHWRRELERAALPEELCDQVQQAAAGKGTDRPCVDLSQVTPFRRRVLQILSAIPHGEVRTYAWVAREAGSPRAVRAVGTACAQNPVPLVVPCHRVVPASGGTGGYAYGPELKREVLRSEGVAVDRLDELERQGVRYLGFPETGEYCFPTCSGALDGGEEDWVLLHDEHEAHSLGLEPCSRCRPLAA